MFDFNTYINYVLTIFMGYFAILIPTLVQTVDSKKSIKQKTTKILLVTTCIFILILILVTFLYKNISIKDVIDNMSQLYVFFIEKLNSDRFRFCYITESICAFISVLIFFVILWGKSIFSSEYFVAIFSALTAFFFLSLSNIGFSSIICDYINNYFEILSILINITLYSLYTACLIELSKYIN